MLTRALVLVGLLGAVPAAAVELKPWSGGVTPPLELGGLDGKSHRLADYRGKVVLVNFWATWCAPCREEMPSLERLRVALKDRPFAVLAVNVAEPEARIRRFLDAVPGGYTVLLDREAKVTRAWQARALPVTYLLGPDGAIRYRHVGDLDWSGPEARKRILELMP